MQGDMFMRGFTPNGKASPLTVASHLQDEAVPVIIRFSNSSPIPSHPDAISPVKGMAVKFHLPNGKVSDLITVTIPLFFAKTPQAFVDIAGFFQSAKEGFPNLKELAKSCGNTLKARQACKCLKKCVLQPVFQRANITPFTHSISLTRKEGGRQSSMSGCQMRALVC